MSMLKEFAFLAPGADAEDLREPGSPKEVISRALNKQKAARAMAFTRPAPAAEGGFAGPSQAQPQLEHPAPSGEAAAAPGDASDPMPKPKERPKKKKVKPAAVAGRAPAGGSRGTPGGPEGEGKAQSQKPQRAVK